ncbi:MAG: hypothetical protein U0T84_02120 [Chitinophagales bacterium]
MTRKGKLQVWLMALALFATTSVFSMKQLCQIHIGATGKYTVGFVDISDCKEGVGICLSRRLASDKSPEDYLISSDNTVYTAAISKNRPAEQLRVLSGGVLTMGEDSYLNQSLAIQLGFSDKVLPYIPKGEYRVTQDRNFYYVTFKMAGI